MTYNRKIRSASQSFLKEEVDMQCKIWHELLRGGDVQQLLRSLPARNLMRKFTRMRDMLVQAAASAPENTDPTDTDIQ